nr:hypothetical protein [Couchioplanes caeruleus]
MAFESVEEAEAEAAAPDQPDLGVDAFEAGVGQAELDRGNDGFGVFSSGVRGWRMRESDCTVAPVRRRIRLNAVVSRTG